MSGGVEGSWGAIPMTPSDRLECSDCTSENPYRFFLDFFAEGKGETSTSIFNFHCKATKIMKPISFLKSSQPPLNLAAFVSVAHFVIFGVSLSIFDRAMKLLLLSQEA